MNAKESCLSSTFGILGACDRNMYSAACNIEKKGGRWRYVHYTSEYSLCSKHNMTETQNQVWRVGFEIPGVLPKSMFPSSASATMVESWPISRGILPVKRKGQGRSPNDRGRKWAIGVGEGLSLARASVCIIAFDTLKQIPSTAIVAGDVGRHVVRYQR